MRSSQPWLTNNDQSFISLVRCDLHLWQDCVSCSLFESLSQKRGYRIEFLAFWLNCRDHQCPTFEWILSGENLIKVLKIPYRIKPPEVHTWRCLTTILLSDFFVYRKQYYEQQSHYRDEIIITRCPKSRDSILKHHTIQLLFRNEKLIKFLELFAFTRMSVLHFNTL